MVRSVLVFLRPPIQATARRGTAMVLTGLWWMQVTALAVTATASIPADIITKTFSDLLGRNLNGKYGNSKRGGRMMKRQLSRWC